MMKPKLLTLRDIVYVFFKNKTAILMIIFTAVATAVGYCVFADPIYRAETKILVRLGRETISAVSNMPKDYNILFQERRQNINNELEILKGNHLDKAVFQQLKVNMIRITDKGHINLREKVKAYFITGIRKIKEFLYWPFYYSGLIQKISDDDRLMLIFSNSFECEFKEETDILLLKFKWNNPHFAAYAVNAYASEYLKHHTQVYDMEKSYNFYTDQIQLYNEKLIDAENSLQSFLKDKKISDISHQKEILLQDIASLEKKYSDALIDYNDVMIKIKGVKQMRQIPDRWIETPMVGMLGEEFTDLKKLDDAYFALKSEYNKLIERYKPTSEMIKDLDSRLERLRVQKAESLLNILTIDQDTITSEIRFLENSLSEMKDRLDKLNSLSLQLEQLNRSKDIIKDNFLLYKNKAEELRISDNLNKSKILSVIPIGEAIPPLKPAYPRKSLIIGISFFVGIFLSFAFSSTREFFDHTFQNEENVSNYLQAPFLTTIPIAQLQKDVFTAATDSKNLKEIAIHSKGRQLESRLLRLPSFDDEFYKIILTLRETTEQESFAIMLSSCNHREGASTIAFNFATALIAAKKKSVLLVDGNLRTPVLHHQFDLKRDNGLTELIQGRINFEEAIHEIEPQHFYFLASGRPSQNPSMLYGSEGLKHLLLLLKAKFDLIIFDSPPILPYPETLILGSILDGLIMILKAGSTKWEVGAVAQSKIELTKSRLLGIILNQKKYFIPKTIYRLL